VYAIAVAGHVCVDVRPKLGIGAVTDPGKLIEIGPATIRIGGIVGNTALDLTALGASVRVFATIGDDVFGRLIAAELAADPLIVADPEVIHGGSTSYSIIVEPAGVDRTIWHHVGANASFTGRGLQLTGIDLLHLGYPSLLPGLLLHDGEQLVGTLAAARANGVTTSVDLAVVDPLSPVGGHDWARILTRMAAVTDVLSPSLDDITSALHIDEPYSPALVARLARLLIDRGAAVVAISAGEHGLHLETGSLGRLRDAGAALAPHAAEWADRTLDLPAITVDVPATTNGAGDASSAGLIFGIACEAGPERSALLAAACAAALVGGEQTTANVIGRILPDPVHLIPKTS
jgi:sugar/nucleoside kinase (ribokinase family)